MINSHGTHLTLVAVLLCGATGLSAGSGLSLRASDQSKPLSQLLEASRHYVQDYKEKLTFIIADETYVQTIRHQIPLDPKMPTARTTQSEIYFILVPQTREWLAIRDVTVVDGEVLHDRPNLASMAAAIPVPQVAVTLKTYNSRFNIGRIFRNFNEPTIGLQILDARYQGEVDFQVKHSEVDHGDSLTTLSYREKGPETLIHDLLMKPAPSTGEVVVEDRTGRVRRTELTTQIGSVSVQLTTDYSAELGLDMWAPRVFREHYEDGVYTNAKNRLFSGPAYEEVTCEATYSNFRRFEVLGRIKN
jgi:hypothetical protein